ncbi:MAG: glycosyltransferase family 4 protein [Gemmatimonadales bacterium]
MGGVATYTHALAEGLRCAGATVHVVTCWPDPSGTAAPGLAVTRTPAVLNRKVLKTLPLFVATVFRYLRSRPRPDWLMLMKCTHEALVGYALKRLLGARCVLVVYGGDILEQRRNPIARAVFRSADRILACSTYTKGLFEQLGTGGARVHVVHPGIAPSPLLPEDQVRRTRAQHGLEGKLALLTVSRLVKHKGHDQVLRALGMLAARHPNVVYLIVGGGEERASLERQISALGLARRVRLLGALPWDEVEGLYQACDLFVMTSRTEGTDVEGLGMVYLEASLRGKAIVAGRDGGVPDVVQDGETGLLVDPTDPAAIARALDRLLSDAGLRRRMGDAGRRRVLEEFSVERSAERLRQVLADADGGNS